MGLPYKKGSQGPEVKAWQEWAYKNYSSYANLIGSIDSYYGLGEQAFVNEMQRRLGIPQTGVFDLFTANKVGYRIGAGTPVVPTRRKIWIYTNPGSGANWDQGPSFELGVRASDILHINHQPVYFQKGGYLGLLGGDSTYSYVEVTYDQLKSIEYLLDHNPDINDPDIELWFSGYSQSADGLEDAIEVLFGDGGFVHPGDKTQTPCPPGKYRHLRSRINGLVQYGNPSTRHTGIARKVRPEWLYALVHNVNKADDFYAIAPDDIRPAFYAIIIEAETELPFFAHVLRVAVPVILGYIPIIGGLLGPVATPMVAAMAGINNMLPLLMNMMGQANSHDEVVDKTLIDMLSATGLIKNIPGLIQLVASLPGLQHHAMYFDEEVNIAYNVIASYRR